MKLNSMIIPVSLAVLLSASLSSADAAQQNNRRDRGGRDTQSQARDRSADSRERDNTARVQRNDGREDRGQAQRRGEVRERRNDDRGNRGDDRARSSNRGNVYVYSAPQRPAYRHYYGSGGRSSVYFGWGSGYRYGSPYSGRIYGYSGPSAYGIRPYYGDVRLQVRPRDAAVYVDGYYAGVVDDFDGVFQRLTLEVGPHQIEIEAPGLASQVFDVYVDPARTVDLHGDLFSGRP
jgi:hypothetical protein